MLIDFSDILQIDVYELGRTYLRLSQALCINIPAMDPCLYVMRFAHRLEFGEKTHEVSMTALRLVSRMKKDWIHFGRRPSGLCGAALLIAGRLHEFNRSITDVIKVVKVHESTLRKRLNEFGETPASQLTLEEFMTVDLDAMTEEQDPPSFKAARKRDRERLARLEEDDNIDNELSKLESEIEKALEERRGKQKGPYAKMSRSRSSSSETSEASESSEPMSPSNSDTEDSMEEALAAQYLGEETLGIIEQCIDGKVDTEIKSQEQLDYLLMPPPAVTPARHLISSTRQNINSPGMGLRNSVEDYLTQSPQTPNQDNGEKEEDEELDLTGIDDDEIDSYIMSGDEIRLKTKLWLKLNAEYLIEQEEKIKREKLEREELIKAGKDPDKILKRKMKKKLKANHQANGSAIEAIEKIVQEKKISTKINYDVLRSLNCSPIKSDDVSPTKENLNLNLPTSSTGEKRSLSSTSASAAKRIKTEEAAPRPSRVKPNLAARAKVIDIDRGRGRTAEARRTFNFSAFIGNKDKHKTKVEEEGPSSQPTVRAAAPPLDRLSSENNSKRVADPSQDSGVGTQDIATDVPVVLEGPVTDGQAAQQSETDEHDDLEDEDEEEEEDVGVGEELSASQLLMQHMGADGQQAYPEEEEEYY